MVAHHLADRAQLALVAVTLAQQPRDRVAAPIAERREIHGDEREPIEVAGNRSRFLMAVEPHPEPTGAEQQDFAPLEPERERHDDIARRRD